VRHVILDALQHVSESLRARGVSYEGLRNALTPQIDRREIALFFDTTQIERSWYGYEVHEHIIPLFHTESSHSVLHGDLLGSNDSQKWIQSQLSSHLAGGSDRLHYQHSSQFYCVYINNCSDEMVRAFQSGLLSYAGYVGFADVTFASAFKTYLSGSLGTGYLKWRRIIVQQHEDDLPEDANQNTLAYPFEEHGYTCRSIAGIYFGLLLSYKIERPLLTGDERDRIHSLSAISSHPSEFAESTIELDERKYDYLAREKTGTLQRLGILGQPKASLEEMIRAKLRSNYLYSLRFREDYGVAMFNILLELQAIDTALPVRTLASFSFEPERNALRLVTFY